MTSASPLLELAERVRRALADAARAAHGLELDADDIPLEEPRQGGAGDLASSVALPLARTLKKAPRAIADELVAAVPDVSGVTRLEVAGPGYVNVHLDRRAVAGALLRAASAAPAPPGDIHDAPPVADDAPKVIVEHTNINPNKAAHVGHLRNAVLGDCLVRLLQCSGRHVEVQNYIDDTGVQVADVVVGFTAMEGRSPEEARRHVGDLTASSEHPFDHACWDLYARVGRWYREDETRENHRRDTLHAMESGEGALAELGHVIATAIVRCHLRTMARIGVRYHLLPWESDILGAQFWTEAFERMKAAGAVHLQEEGKNAGCWVMPLTESAEFAHLEDPDKVIVRSNGTVTYVGKDIAFQMWKLGLVSSDFRYRPFEAPGADRTGAPLWTTDTSEGRAEGHPPFGHADAVYNVIDVRQSYLQAIVKNALLLTGYGEQAEASVHYGYEMVALTHATAEALGFELTDEDRAKTHVEMSGRRGLGVKADDLLDRLATEATRRVAETNRERGLGLTDDEVARTGEQVAVGALRYYMTRVTRTSVIAFDIDQALQFKGETGPYLQYSAVRTAAIFRRLEEAHPGDGRQLEEALDDAGELLSNDKAWALVMAAARLPDAMQRAVETLEVAPIAKHGFLLSQAWNAFYDDNSILHADSRELRRQRAAVALLYLLTQRQVLGLLGIPEPERM